jgi:hypothetical protein
VSLSIPFTPETVPDTRGWKRAAVFSFGLAMAQCGASTSGSTVDVMPPDAPADTMGDQAVEAAMDAVMDMDHGGVAPPYGIAPQDAGVPADQGSFYTDDGSPPPDTSGDR